LVSAASFLRIHSSPENLYLKFFDFALWDATPYCGFQLMIGLQILLSFLIMSTEIIFSTRQGRGKGEEDICGNSKLSRKHSTILLIIFKHIFLWTTISLVYISCTWGGVVVTFPYMPTMYLG
jgi:hypothetical protein